jgi:hypothetical protein
MLGIILGVALIFGITFVGLNWGTAQIKTANLLLPVPLLFVPK